ncbi:MAG: MATE family efflux transporter, partial [Bacteroidota bacterium]|nr:MATE family efflux transporter [Bacteroidota bacterium]
YIAIVSYWVIGLPSGYLFAFVLDMGPEGIWIGFVFGLTTAAISFLYRFHRRSKTLFPDQNNAQTPSH